MRSFALIAATALLVAAESHSTAQTISSSTAAMFRAHWADDGANTLELLVLLRGTPGWLSRSGSGGSGSGGGGSQRPDGTRFQYAYQSADFGGKTFTINFDVGAQTAKFLDHDIALKDANVVLVDDADTATPTFVGTRWVEPRLTSDSDPIAAVIRQSSELYEYLRCEATASPDPSVPPEVARVMQTMFQRLCARMRGQ